MANASERLAQRATGYAKDAEANLSAVNGMPVAHGMACIATAQAQATLAVFTTLERIALALEGDR